LEFFPESDPLKNRAKDKALAIMEHLVLINQDSGWMSFQKERAKAQLLEDIDILLGYVWIGKSQGWLNSVNCLIIANEYEKIKKEIEPIIGLELTQKLPGIDVQEPSVLQKSAQIAAELVLKDVGPQKEAASKLSDRQTQPPLRQDGASARQSPPSDKLTARQRKILEFLAKNERAQVMDLQTVLPDVTKRTIRRDLDELLATGKIVRLGDFNQVFYQLSPNIQHLTS